MTSTLDPLSLAADLRSRGTPFVLATVVRAVAPTSAHPGDKAVITEDGRLSGWIGGSCAEPIVREEAEAALRDGQTRLLCITPEVDAMIGRQGLRVHSMTCFSGGALDIYLEPYVPEPCLVVFGTSPVGRALAELARVLRYQVTVIDGVDGIAAWPATAPDRTSAVVATHGVFDEESLAAVVQRGLPYVGLVASRRRREQLLAGLRERGVADDLLARIQAPAGVDLGAETPSEIALSILADVVALRRGRRLSAARLEPVAAPPDLVFPRPPTEVAAKPLKPCCAAEAAKKKAAGG